MRLNRSTPIAANGRLDIWAVSREANSTWHWHLIYGTVSHCTGIDLSRKLLAFLQVILSPLAFEIIYGVSVHIRLQKGGYPSIGNLHPYWGADIR